MKYSILKTVFTAFLVIVCISCSSDDGGVNAITDDTFLTAKVDGVDFEVRGSLFAVDSNIGGVISTLAGATYDDESKSISMTITNLNSTGTYALIDQETDDPLTSTYVSIIYGEGKTGWYAIPFLRDVTATITVTELSDSYVLGTFNFIGVDIESKTEKNITDGRFKLKRLNVE